MICRIQTLAVLVAALAGCALASLPAAAQGFAAVVSPPRFEIAAQPGQRVRQVVEISNAAQQPARYLLRTADWQLDSDAGVSFTDALAPGSCRPWVAIERREIEVPPGGQYRYRFEVEPPAGTADGECRFALMIEGDEQTVRTPSGLSLPVSGRIAVIVYVRVGGAAPDLSVVGATVVDANGRSLPALQVHNAGNAHGRLAGFLSGTDAAGRRHEFAPSSLPILPGETRRVVLSASAAPGSTTEIAYPVTVRGVLELGEGRRVDFAQQFTR